MAPEDTDGRRPEGVAGRRPKPYANGSYQTYRWDNAVRQLRRDGWTRLFKLTPARRARALKGTIYTETEGTLYMKWYFDGYGRRQKVFFVLNEATMNALPGNLGNKWLKGSNGG